VRPEHNPVARTISRYAKSNTPDLIGESDLTIATSHRTHSLPSSCQHNESLGQGAAPRSVAGGVG
jgi:hypothetical protein